MEILQVKDLSFRYAEGKKDAINKISFSVGQGEFVLVCGQSGCGKSTLLRLLKKDLMPYGQVKGEIVYQDIDDKQIQVGFVLQNPDNQIVTDKVWHEMAFGLENVGVCGDEIRRRVAEMANYFGIEDWFRKDTDELSGGQKQMLNLASVMVMQPKILLLDEPTAQLDPIAASNFIANLHKLNEELGVTIIIVEHHLEEVFPIADRLIVMDEGAISYDGSPREIIDFIKNDLDNPIICGLPSAVRIYHKLNGNGKCPLTVKDGRDFIRNSYANHVKNLQNNDTKFFHDVILDVKDIWFSYNKLSRDILRGLSLKVHRGEHICILGGNGAGKSTLISCIAGIIKPYHGKIILNGKELKAYSEKELRRENIAFLPQNPTDIFVENSVREDFYEVLRAMECEKQDIDKRIDEMVNKLEISHLMEKHPYDLSGGEQQKVALAKVLLLQPKLLLLDEPTKGIDSYHKDELSKLLRELNDEGITIITVTHDIEFAAGNADRCAMLFDGEMVSLANTRDFFKCNNFYTTAANRITRGYYDNAILCDDVVKLCRANERKVGV